MVAHIVKVRCFLICPLSGVFLIVSLWVFFPGNVDVHPKTIHMQILAGVVCLGFALVDSSHGPEHTRSLSRRLEANQLGTEL